MVGASGRDDMEDARLGEEELRQGAGKIRSAIADQLEQALLASRASVMLHDAEHVAHLPAAAVLPAVFLDDGAAGGAQEVGDRKSTRLNSSPYCASRMPSSTR